MLLNTWRLLQTEYQPRTAERAAQLRVALLTLQPVSVTMLARAIAKVESKFILHDSVVVLPEDHITEGGKRAVFTRIAPPTLMIF